MYNENTPSHEFDPADYPAWAFEMYDEGAVTHEVLEEMKNYPNESSYHIEIDLRMLEEDVANQTSKEDVSQDFDLLMSDIKDASDRHEKVAVPNMEQRLGAIKSYLETKH